MNRNSSEELLKQGCVYLDEKLEEELYVYDSEDGGVYRYYSFKDGYIDIVQTGGSDEVVFVYRGNDKPESVKVYRNGVEVKEVYGSDSGGVTIYKLSLNFNYNDIYSVNNHLSPVGQVLKACSQKESLVVKGFAKNIRINLFNPDQWYVSVSLPPVKGLKLGVVYDNKDVTKKVVGKKDINKVNEIDGSVKDKKITLTVEQESWDYKTKSSLEETYRSYSAKVEGLGKLDVNTRSVFKESPVEVKNNNKTITVKRNNLEVKVDSLEALGSIINLTEALYKAVKGFRDHVPEIGWYIDFGVKIFQGHLAVSWGWRENSKDHRAYYYMGAYASIKFLDIYLEIGFGASVGDIKAQICVKIAGETSLTFPKIERLPLEHNKTEAKKDVDLGKLEGKTTAGGYVRCAAGNIVNIEGSIESSISISCDVKLSSSDGVSIDGPVKWDGVTVAITVNFYDVVSEKCDKKLMDEKSPIGEVQYPKKKKLELSEMKSISEADAVVNEVFTKGCNVGLYELFEEVIYEEDTILDGWKLKTLRTNTGEMKEVNVKMDISLLTQLVAQRIWRERKIIKLDKKTVHGLAQVVRKWIVQKSTNEGRADHWHWVYTSELDEFLSSSIFGLYISDAKDPVKDLISKV